MGQDLLRIMTCGSVDDGKSTLIGRLLWESGAIFEDQYRAVVKDSKKYGTQGDEVDLALLLDGLSAEREQGITIDVAYRYFSSSRRRFIIADSPGHEEYTRNMATAASKSQAVILLADVSKGLQDQTYRHAKIASLLGLRHLVLAINKMDKVDHSEEAFATMKNIFLRRVGEWGFDTIQCIPVSALRGDNIVQRSKDMDWYQGKTVLETLEGLSVEESETSAFRFPVQIVHRPDSQFRGYMGSIASGEIRTGELVVASHSQQTARIKEIIFSGRTVAEAKAPHAITLVLDREIDLSRGDVLMSSLGDAETHRQFEAQLFWMNAELGFRGRNYRIQLGTQEATASLVKIKSRLNLQTLNEEPANSLGLNEISRVEVSVQKPLTITSYQQCRELGSFILVDKTSHETLAAGVITHGLRRSENVHRQSQTIGRTEREALNGHKAKVIWITGLSGSGKSTLANALEIELHRQGYRTFILDGDNIRLGLNKDLGFSDADRIENIRRIAEVSKLMMEAGIVVITAFISPFEEDRKMAAELIGVENFCEIYLSTPLNVCEKRDPKGLYKKARSGQIPNFSGVNSRYEPPTSPDLVIDTSSLQVADGVQTAMKTFFED